MPWLVAAFIAMLWLVPFNTISMNVSLPFEVKLDRIVLPFVVLAWGAALIIGGRNSPRMYLSRIHLAIGGYIAVAFASVLLNLNWLNHQLLLDSSLKALLLLLSFGTLFVIVASVVRPGEVRAFVKYSLVLSVICGVGALYEYKFKYDPFYQLAHTIFPSGLFTVPIPNAHAVDELGRRLTRGPAEEPLELAVMMAIALPIALVGLMEARRRRDQVLYGLAACVLLAAGVATFRKSSLLDPVVVVAALVAFRPRRALRFVPLVPVIIVAVHLMAPGAIGSVVDQLAPGKVTAVGTTASRTSAYEAVRPYVWTRPAFGQGYGSYNPAVIRIFDSQILDSVLETGVVGLAAYLLMSLTVLITARPLFRVRGSPVAPLALALGVTAIVFLVSSFLFDEMGFPHVPYIFLTFAAFVTILVRSAGERPASAHRTRPRSTVFARRRVHVLEGGARRVHSRRSTA